MAGQLVHAVERARQAQCQAGVVEPAKLACAAGGQQVQPDIGGRCAVRHHGVGVELHIVGRQPVVVGRDRALEPGPDVLRNALQILPVVGRQRVKRHGAGHRPGPADPGNRQRPQRPGQQQRQGKAPGHRAAGGLGQHQAQRDQACRDGQPAVLAQQAGQVGAGVGLRGGSGGPLQQVPARHRLAPQRAGHRVHAQPGRCQQRADMPQHAAHPAQRACARMAVEAGQLNAVVARRQRCQRAHQGPDAVGRQHQPQRPARRQAQAQPGRHQQRQRARRHARAAQVVQHLPDMDRRQTPAPGVQQKGQQLPVAPRPAVQARCGHVGMQWRIFDQHHIADAGTTHQRAFQQVVAQHLVLRQPAGQHPRAGGHVDQALADGAAFVEQVLVDLGAGRAVRVDAALAGKQAAKQRAVALGVRCAWHCRQQRRGDPGLQHAVAAHHHRAAGGQVAQHRAVQRMGRHGHQIAQAAGRQGGVCIERNQVLHLRGRGRQRPQVNKAAGHCGHPAMQPRGQLHQQRLDLAALALPADPASLGGRPAAPAMQQQKAQRRAGRHRVALVQGFDARLRGQQQRQIGGGLLVRRIGPV